MITYCIEDLDSGTITEFADFREAEEEYKRLVKETHLDETELESRLLLFSKLTIDTFEL